MRRHLALLLLAPLLGDDPAPRPAPASVELAGPMEVRVRYAPRIDAASEKAIVEDALRRTIAYYEPHWLEGEAAPKGEPLGRLRIAGARVADEGATLILSTDPHPRRAVYVLDWIDASRPDEARYLYSGVETAWYYGDEEATPRMTFVRPRLAQRPGEGGQIMGRDGNPSRIEMRTTLLPPKGAKSLLLKGNMPFQATVGDKDVGVGEGSTRQAEVELNAPVGPISLFATLETAETGPRSDFSASWKGDGRDVPLAMEHLALPWLPIELAPPTAPKPPFDLAGGDPAKGEAVFRSEGAKCATCHAVGGKGGAIGPNLDSQKGRELAEVYYDIAEPSARIAPEYRTYTVARKNGEIAVGVLRAEGTDALRVLDINGQATVIPRSDVEEMNPSATSTMPVGLAGALGEAGMRDLLAFLTKKD